MRVLYLTHNPLGSALVRSQVLPYLRGLDALGHDVRLMTFERGEPTPTAEFDLTRWHAIVAMGGSHLVAKTADIARGVVHALRIVLSRRVSALHARSYIPAAICWVIRLLARRPYIFDMRGFLGDEYIDGGRWTRSDIRYRVLQWAEKWLLRDAAEIVVLTQAAASRLRDDPIYSRSVGARPVTVIPCAVDLERFRPRERRAERPTLVYAGSLGMSYLIEEMLLVYAFAREDLPEIRMRILNREEHPLILRAIQKVGVDPVLIELRAADFAAMPQAIGEGHVAIALLHQVPSKAAASPIKIAEYLACGLPTIVNAGLGESAELIRRYEAGHVVESFEDGDLRRAGAAVVRLIGDEEARRNARRLAEEVYSLGSATARYAEVYARVERAAAGGRPNRTGR